MHDHSTIPEEWRIIAEFPKYSVSNLGRVMRSSRGNGAVLGRVLQMHQQKRSGRVIVALGHDVSRLVHRLVAKAFIPNPDGLPEVDHLDGNPVHNCAINLEWVTSKENHRRAWALGLMHPSTGHVWVRGEGNGNAKLSEADVLAIRSTPRRNGVPQELAKQYGMSIHQIRKIRYRHSWKHVS